MLMKFLAEGFRDYENHFDVFAVFILATLLRWSCQNDESGNTYISQELSVINPFDNSVLIVTLKALFGTDLLLLNRM